jgi:hypothetical protein
MEIKTIASVDSDAKVIKVKSWNVTEITERYMKIQVKFMNPAFVSAFVRKHVT